MRRFLNFMASTTIGTSAAVITWLFSFFVFDVTFLMSGLYAAAGGGSGFIVTKEALYHSYLRRKGLSRKEYKYIKENLQEANTKIKRVQRTLHSVRNLRQAKEYLEILVTIRKIYTNTKQDPRRFYLAEPFFYKHLDSLTALMEKYAYLKTQPSRTEEINQSLKETTETITRLNEVIKKDLHVMLHDDVDTLQFELDVANQTYGKVRKRESEALK